MFNGWSPAALGASEGALVLDSDLFVIQCRSSSTGALRARERQSEPFKVLRPLMVAHGYLCWPMVADVQVVLIRKQENYYRGEVPLGKWSRFDVSFLAGFPLRTEEIGY